VRSVAAQLKGAAFVQEHGDLVAVGVSCDIAHKKHVTLLIDNGFSSSMVVRVGADSREGRSDDTGALC
jgi:hypothetical protein